MAEDLDEIYSADELLGIWDDNEPEEKEDPWDFSGCSQLYRGIGKSATVVAKEVELAVVEAKQQALTTLILMLLKGRPVLSARKLCRVASFSVGDMEYPDVEMILLMAGYVQFAYAKRRRPDSSKDNFKGYASKDWRFTNFCHYTNHYNSDTFEAVQQAMYENHRRIALPWEERLTLSSRKALAALPVVLFFEIDIDTEKVPGVTVPFREFQIAAPPAECVNITKFVAAYNRQPEKYSLPTNLEEWQDIIPQLDYDDYICR